MNLGRQWNDRLEIWNNSINKYYSYEFGTVDCEYFTTYEHLSYEQATTHSFEAAPAGMQWGKKWQYGWFRTSFTADDSCEGKRLIVKLAVGPEMLVYVNGKEAGAIDKKHEYVTLCKECKPGDSFEIYAECYAGHGVRLENAGPYDNDEIPVPEPPLYQCEVKASKVYVWNEDAFQAGMDFSVLYMLMKELPDDSLRGMKIADALKEFTYIADFELDEPMRTQSFVEASKGLKPLLECRNGDTVPEFTVFGQSHLDLAWLWTEMETKRKSARTYSNQLALMDEYPDYLFLMCEPKIMDYLKTYYPKLYESVKEKVQSGNFIPEGAMWVEGDTNIVTGESLIRQFKKGKEWFREEYGADSVMAWMPDTFGYSAALPQIMKKCQVEYFSTQKLLNADPETEQFPYNNFWWEGIDGTRILSHIYKKCNGDMKPGGLIKRWNKDRNQKENIDGLIYPFGYGDGGGGPVREDIEVLKRCKNLEGMPMCKVQSPVKFFEKLETQKVDNVFCGELYLAWHRGTYTAQAETKKGIRKAEATLREYEFWLSILFLEQPGMRESDTGKYFEEELDRLWERMLFNEFHDIAPGSSIQKVHEEAVSQLHKITERSQELLNNVIKLLDPASEYYAFNSLPWDRKYAMLEQLPEMVIMESSIEPSKELSGNAKQFIMQNRYLKAVFDENARLVSLIAENSNEGNGISERGNVSDKNGFEFIASAGNCFKMFKDVNTCYDAWELGRMYDKMPVDTCCQTVEIVERDGRKMLHTHGRINNSKINQFIKFSDDGKRLDFETEIDWNERHKLLKVEFDTNIHTMEAVSDTQYGYVKRPTHRSRQADRDMYEFCNQKFTAFEDGAHTFALLNDGKNGISVAKNDGKGTSMALSLLRAPVIPDMTADKGVHKFTYSVYADNTGFRQSNVYKEAYDLNYPLVYAQEIGNLTHRHIKSSGFATTAKNVIIEYIKPADDTNMATIRIYESMGMDTVSMLKLPEYIGMVYESDMIEENREELIIENESVKLHFGPFEVKTILVKRR